MPAGNLTALSVQRIVCRGTTLWPGMVVMVSLLCAVCCNLHSSEKSRSVPIAWRTLDSGLTIADIQAPAAPAVGPGRISIVRFDPRFFDLKLMSAAQHDSLNRTAREWCATGELIAAINAGMYATDYRTHIGYMKNFGYVNNPHLRKDHKTVLVFNPVSADLTPIRIVDLTCHDFSSIRKEYRTFVQNIRMVGCQRQNVWQPQPRRSSIACLATDGNGMVMFIFSESPWQVSAFVDLLLDLPLDIASAMYLEGGAPASLYLKYKNVEIVRNGIYEAGDQTQRTFSVAFPLPHVLGIVRRQKRSGS